MTTPPPDEFHMSDKEDEAMSAGVAFGTFATLLGGVGATLFGFAFWQGALFIGATLFFVGMSGLNPPPE